MIEVKLLTTHPVLGALREPGAVVCINEGCAADLIERGIAQRASQAKPLRKAKKRASKKAPAQTPDDAKPTEDSDGLIVE